MATTAFWFSETGQFHHKRRLIPRAPRALGLGEMCRGVRSSREALEDGSGVLTLERRAEALQQLVYGQTGRFTSPGREEGAQGTPGVHGCLPPPTASLDHKRHELEPLGLTLGEGLLVNALAVLVGCTCPRAVRGRGGKHVSTERAGDCKVKCCGSM